MNKLRGCNVPDNERTLIARLPQTVRPKLASIFSLFPPWYPLKSSIRMGLPRSFSRERVNIDQFNVREEGSRNEGAVQSFRCEY